MDALGQVAAELARFGARFDPEVLQRTRALYRPLVEAQRWSARPAIADVAYGGGDRHRLDIYPADRSRAPVLVFVHGGGFVAGDKANDPPFYGNVGRYFAEAGYCAVAMNYRLAPASGWPAGAEDVARALDWVVAEIADHGGDPSAIVLLGQSAGASHCATYLFDQRVSSAARERVRGAALLSGFYLAREPLAGGPRDYFGDEPEAWRDRSPASHVKSPHVPLLLSVAELDPGWIADQTLLLARALLAVDARAPRLVWFEGENHVSAVHGLGVGPDHAGAALRSFFAACLSHG